MNNHSPEQRQIPEHERMGVLTDQPLQGSQSPDEIRQARKAELESLKAQEGPGVVSPNIGRELGRFGVGKSGQVSAESHGDEYHQTG